MSQSAHSVAADRKDTVGLHVTMNDVLRMQIAKKKEKKKKNR